MVFNPQQTRQSLKPFDIRQIVPKHGAIADYCRFYHLDFEQDFRQVKHSCGYFEVANYWIAAHSYIVPNSKGTVWIIHGYLEHSGLYRHIIPVLLTADFNVVIYDLPAHGLSSGVRASINHFGEYQTVLQHLLDYFEPHLAKPYLGLGQSTGGAILMDYTLSACANRQQPVFDKLFLLAPLIYPAKMQWLQMKFASWWFRSVRTGLPRIFRRNTSDVDFVRFMRDEDPLQARWIPVSWLLALKEWIEYIHRLPQCPVPVFIVQGGQDKTVNGQYNVEFIKQKFNVMSVLWLEEAGHQLANERESLRQAILKLLRDFLLFSDKNVS
ncbi:MAG: alpha/beta hydrolase [Moraxellaceae bacterium]|nr:alpha/beta hydrolase [Moraxellaceae bacterium]MCP5175936.1 alpha/beta hydrolase [Moraxellaceae bacterium]